VFHSVSAFCNAGFSLYSDSLASWTGNPLFIATVAVLVIAGGLGHVVLEELSARLRRVTPDGSTREARGLSCHSRLVLVGSLTLLLLGWIGLALTSSSPGGMPGGERLGGSLFQSVSARTAGFSTWEIGSLSPAALLLLVFLMFVGGSPASCAGGIKTTTFAVWLAGIRSKLKGTDDVSLMGRTVPAGVTARAGLLVGLAVVWNFLGLLVLTTSERQGRPAVVQEALFEQVSAFGTVGLSTGLTPGLTTIGKLWIALTMFVGRLGPLTLATWMTRNGAVRVKYPEGRILIG
jgi:trk system potassium uptake protein TrkH